jgi:hypothetical protein
VRDEARHDPAHEARRVHDLSHRNQENSDQKKSKISIAVVEKGGPAEMETDRDGVKGKRLVDAVLDRVELDVELGEEEAEEDERVADDGEQVRRVGREADEERARYERAALLVHGPRAHAHVRDRQQARDHP